VDSKSVGFAGGESAEVDAVIWATGYKDDSKWVAIPEVKDGRGGFAQRDGVSPVPGLYFIGRSWQWTRGSALLHGVGDDAACVVSRITEWIPGRMTMKEDGWSRDGTNSAVANAFSLRE
jgi:putative flavoprotein involved in K+ transport